MQIRTRVRVFVAGCAIAACGVAVARPTFDGCAAAVLRAPADYWSYACYLQVAAATGRWDEAAARLDAYLSADPSNYMAMTALAGAESTLGHERGERLYREAIDGFVASKDYRSEVYTRLGLASFLQIQRRLDEAGSVLDRAGEAAEALGHPGTLAAVRIKQGWQAYRQGDYGRGVAFLKAVESVVFPDGFVYDRGEWLSAMGALFWVMGRSEEALSCYKRRADLLHSLGDLHEEATARGNAALLTAKTKVGPWTPHKKQEVLDLLNEARAIAVQGGNRRIEAQVGFDLADWTDSIPEKRRLLKESLAICDEIRTCDNYYDGVFLLAESLVVDEPTDRRQAFRLLDHAVEDSRRRGDLVGLRAAQSGKANVEWHAGRIGGWTEQRRRRAVEASMAAIETTEAIRNLQADELVRAGFFADTLSVYRIMVANLLWPPAEPPAPGDVALAFATIERMRSRVLLDAMDAARATIGGSVGDPRFVDREELLRDIGEVQRRLADQDMGESDREKLLRRMNQLQSDEKALRSELAEDYPRFAAVRSPRLASMEDVAGTLQDSEALLLYHVWYEQTGLDRFTGGSWLILVRPDEARVYRVPGRNEIEESVKLLVGTMLNRDGSERAAVKRLYDDLVGDALADLPSEVNRLIIVPDGPLYRLPFGALRADAESPPLATRYRISLAPSATAWLRWRSGESGATEKPAIAFADPDLSAFLVALEPVEPTAAPPHERYAAPAGLDRLGALPGARVEAGAMKSYLGRGVVLLEGPEATEDAVKRTGLDRFKIVHFGTHAVVDHRSPDRSAIVLAPGSPGEDGLLRMREIVNLDLAGRLVVLSACQSASGTRLEGEGVLSLARSFFVAGAHAVIGGLWPLRDDETAALLSDFYRHLGDGSSVAEALAAARGDRVRAGAPPAAWAGVVLFGDGDLVPFPGGRGYRWPSWVVVLAAVLLVFAIGGLTRRRRRDLFAS